MASYWLLRQLADSTELSRSIESREESPNGLMGEHLAEGPSLDGEGLEGDGSLNRDSSGVLVSSLLFFTLWSSISSCFLRSRSNSSSSHESTCVLNKRRVKTEDRTGT